MHYETETAIALSKCTILNQAKYVSFAADQSFYQGTCRTAFAAFCENTNGMDNAPIYSMLV